MLFLLLFALVVSRDLCLFSSGVVTISSFVIVFIIYSCCFSCCVMRVLLAVVLWRNVLTSGVSCRALNRNNCLFSSLFFSSFFLFFPPPCEEEVSAFLLLALNPDSRAQRENRDLFVGFFFTNHLFFAKNAKNDHPKHQIIIGPFFSSFDSSYINAPRIHILTKWPFRCNPL